MAVLVCIGDLDLDCPQLCCWGLSGPDLPLIDWCGVFGKGGWRPLAQVRAALGEPRSHPPWFLHLGLHHAASTSAARGALDLGREGGLTATLAHEVHLAQPGPVDGAGRKCAQIQASTLLSEQAASTGTSGPFQWPGPGTLSTLSAPLTSLSGSWSQ